MTNIILKSIVIIILALITKYVIPYLKSKNLYDEAMILVKSAEQIIKGTKRGKEKYEYVLQRLKEKYNITEETAKNIIESAVYEINQES